MCVLLLIASSCLFALAASHKLLSSCLNCRSAKMMKAEVTGVPGNGRSVTAVPLHPHIRSICVSHGIICKRTLSREPLTHTIFIRFAFSENE